MLMKNLILRNQRQEEDPQNSSAQGDSPVVPGPPGCLVYRRCVSVSPWPVDAESPLPVSASCVPCVWSDFCRLTLMDDLQRAE